MAGRIQPMQLPRFAVVIQFGDSRIDERADLFDVGYIGKHLRQQTSFKVGMDDRDDRFAAGSKRLDQPLGDDSGSCVRLVIGFSCVAGPPACIGDRFVDDTVVGQSRKFLFDARASHAGSTLGCIGTMATETAAAFKDIVPNVNTLWRLIQNEPRGLDRSAKRACDQRVDPQRACPFGKILGLQPTPRGDRSILNPLVGRHGIVFAFRMSNQVKLHRRLLCPCLQPSSQHGPSHAVTGISIELRGE